MNRSTRWVRIAVAAGVVAPSAWACSPGSEIVAEGHLVYVRGLEADATGVYWVDDPNSVGSPGGVWHLENGQEPVRLSDGKGNGTALDDTHVYWFDREAEEVRRVPKAGGAIEVVAGDLGEDSGFALTDKRVLIVDAGVDARILSVRKDGQELEVVAPSIGRAGWEAYPVVFRDRLYWQRGSELVSLPVAGGTVRVERQGGLAAGSLAADELGVYFTTEVGTVMWLPGDRDPIALASDQYWSRVATPVGAYVYYTAWAGEDESEVLLRRVPRDGGGVETLAVNDVLLYDIAARPGGPVYFSDGDLLVRAVSP
jgi:hypothetical protein